ncbi:DUF2332 domain-containing protein [Qingshengfaniella alkalisoli]|uniref:DUF2332 domain-containing protein n=1 Tax=Qingshengfaniella alkalisoli TaxID=2599296 RepID=A0A5B8IVC9_9RHOB|nr:DUF2332 domain-containing protein [Qingshengfaniella alkalisoli]QDY69403.1 DUF2332 domain-containing protein [Qingshengfaniella alkalisoli]
MRKSRKELADRYLAFAHREAHGVSPTYEIYATSAAENDDLLDRLLELPDGKQQPNLLFASTRHVVGLPDAGLDFAQHALAAWDELRPVILRRSTQTNEPGRCACLLPALAQFDEPLAIIEVGAAAGLCLLPDRYGYDYGRAMLRPTERGAPVFPCKASNTTPIPTSLPEIKWRAGLDLNPLDVRSDEDMQWLKTLVWPEQTERYSRLEAAITLARRDPPNVIAGDLLEKTEALAAQAPTDARLVIFHTAVLNYVAPEVRKEFATLVHDLGAEWLANEGANILPNVASTNMLEDRPGAFVLSHNGCAIARTGPHGQFVDWL